MNPTTVLLLALTAVAPLHGSSVVATEEAVGQRQQHTEQTYSQHGIAKPKPVDEQVERDAPRSIWLFMESVWKNPEADPVAFFTFVLAIATSLLFLANIASTLVACWAASAAGRSARIAEHALTRGERAYVSAEVERLPSIDGGSLLVGVALTNYGATPALNCVMKASTGIHPHPLPDSFALPDQEWAKHGVVIFPKQAYPYATVTGAVVTDGLRKELFDDTGAKKAVYAYGAVAYDDIFGKRHSTEFCYSAYDAVDPDGKRAVGWSPVPGRNSAD